MEEGKQGEGEGGVSYSRNVQLESGTTRRRTMERRKQDVRGSIPGLEKELWLEKRLLFSATIF